jgi:hypothetical protein
MQNHRATKDRSPSIALAVAGLLQLACGGSASSPLLDDPGAAPQGDADASVTSTTASATTSTGAGGASGVTGSASGVTTGSGGGAGGNAGTAVSSGTAGSSGGSAGTSTSPNGGTGGTAVNASCPAQDLAADGGCLPGHFYEAESGQLSLIDPDAGASTFTVVADTTASGGHHIAAPAGIYENQPGPARASYDINITKPDAYVIWGRFYAPDRVHNCVWLRVDAGAWAKWRGTTGETWFWYAFHIEGDFTAPVVFQLSMGHHVLEIANCTDNTKLDRLYITAGGDRPLGEETLCNPPHTVQMGGRCVPSCGQVGGTSCDPVACGGHTLLPGYDCAVCCALSSEAGAAP